MARTLEAVESVSTTNACKLCAPLGACLAYRGVEGALPFLHGSQGCSTYIRRYLISHFNEPMDIASSSFSEASTVFGGESNFRAGIGNVVEKYDPSLIGVATTCLTETIGENVHLLVRECVADRDRRGLSTPLLVHASTPAYCGTHMEGFHAAVRALVAAMADGGPRHAQINVMPGMVSAADLRYLGELLEDFGVPAVVLPDYSDTLDGPTTANYSRIPPGGTPLAGITRMGRASATIELGRTLSKRNTAGVYLEERFEVPRRLLGLPIGVLETDRMFESLQEITHCPVPEKHQAERGRLVDAYVDGHKYVAGKRAVIYGEEDLVVGLASFLAEIGIIPVLCASGGRSGRLSECVSAVTADLREPAIVREGADFQDIADIVEQLKPDLIVGHSKGYSIARQLGVALVRVGFPIHDRIGGQRILHLGYRGAQQLFDLVANALIQAKQDGSRVGYSYM